MLPRTPSRLRAGPYFPNRGRGRIESEAEPRERIVKLKIVQVGDQVLRQQARPLTPDEIRGASIQQLIDLMRETMRDAPGVGLAAPQVGEAVQLVVIEDRPEYRRASRRAPRRARAPGPFHVLVNPLLTVDRRGARVFFEGCLSVSGFAALTPRAAAVRVEA